MIFEYVIANAHKPANVNVYRNIGRDFNLPLASVHSAVNQAKELHPTI
jgi:hypothetical protein